MLPFNTHVKLLRQNVSYHLFHLNSAVLPAPANHILGCADGAREILVQVAYLWAYKWLRAIVWVLVSLHVF